jgi:Kef-type K+ transport system membrane component KefB
MALELQVSLVLLFSLAGYLLAARINQSAVIGIIVLGIIMGPSLLGVIEYSEAVEMLAHLGAIILLFAIGLEFKLREIYQLKYMFIALVGIAIPWVVGYFLGVFFDYGFTESMFIGVALTATSIAITANVLREMGKLNTQVAKAIIGAAVVDDVLGLLALSVAVQTTKGNFDITGILLTGAKALAFLVLAIFVEPYIKKLFFKLDERPLAKKFPDFLFITAVMFCFLYASIAELIGLSAIVGAFLAGAVLEDVKFKNSKNLKEGAEYLHIIFGAIFFISLGILADLRELTLDIVPFLTILLIVAVLTKVAGCGIASRLSGFNRVESLVIGFGMSPRGEVAMIVGLIGLTSNVISQNLYISIMLMALITTIITPIVIRNFLKW